MPTSPVPDMAAPPGMCPGVAVLGGGGAGGDGDGSGNGGKDGAGGDGNGNGNGGNGDGKGSGACGQGGAGGCQNCHHKVAGGDPVDLATGEMFTLPTADLKSPGFVDLVFQREYTTRLAGVDLGLGHGWTHTFAWRFECRRRDILIQKGCGSRAVLLAYPTQSEPSWIGDWVLSVAGHNYVLDTGDGYRHTFAPASATADHYLLRSVEHATGHAFLLEYDAAGRLAAIIDSAGRRIVVEQNRGGRIASLSITEPATGYIIYFARYEYDDRGDLIGVTNADGWRHTYSYDEEHRMVHQRYPDGPVFHYVYDAQGRCVETWGETEGGPDPALAPDLSPVLEDRKTRARGFAHIRLDFFDDGYVECSNSVGLQRLFVDGNGNITKAVSGGAVTEHAFDDHGNVAARIGPLGATTTYRHDRRGRLIAETDPLGRTVRIERDSSGHPIRNTDYAGHTVSRTLDARGNPITITNQRGAVTTYEYDEHGTVSSCTTPLGGTTRYLGDHTGSTRVVTTPNGASWGFDYDYFGRLVRRTDPLGRTVSFGYTPSGLMRWARQEDLHIEYTYNGMGRVTRVAAPEGTYEIRWGGFGWPYERIEPNGDRIRAQYNREGWPVRHFNQAGETYEFTYDANGLCTKATRFHGATIQNKYDAAHHRTRYVLGTMEGLTSVRDIVGRETALEFSDGRTIELDYHLSGEIAHARTPEGTFRFEYDEVGNVVAEYQEADGEVFWVKARYDLADHLVELDTSVGHRARILRDPSGERRALALDDETTIAYERNLVGLETALLLPGGARVETEYDERYRVSCRRVRVPRQQPAIGAGEPGWVGSDPTVTVERAYRFAATDDLVEVVDRDRGVTRYSYDARRRLEARVTEKGETERFLSDPTSNLYERGPSAKEREYGRGNLLLRRGDTRYAYDCEGRLVEKVAPGPAGTVLRWRYTWNAHDHLTSVETPEGLRVVFTYDPFARRITKQIWARHETGGSTLVRRTRYVWFGHSLIHEVTTTCAGDRRVRTYAHTDRRIQPFAHRDEGEQWCYYVGDIIHTPELIIAGDGRVVGELERSAYGITRAAPGSRVTTAIRFAGQQADDETGLHYNLHRYYDPETGRYISPDPLGIDAGENHFIYCLGNPIGFVDTVGLAGHGASCELDIKNGQQTTTWVPYSDPKSKQNPEPGVLKSGYKQNKKVVNVPGAMEKDNEKNVIHTGKDKLGKTKNTEQPKAHTEQHATEWAEKNFEGKLKGSHMKLGGKLPPCQICNDKMAKFAKDHDATVDYAYPKNNKFTYTKAGGPFASSTDGKPLVKKQDNLAAAYQDRNSGGPSTGYNEYLVAKGTRKK